MYVTTPASSKLRSTTTAITAERPCRLTPRTVPVTTVARNARLAGNHQMRVTGRNNAEITFRNLPTDTEPRSYRAPYAWASASRRTLRIGTTFTTAIAKTAAA